MYVQGPNKEGKVKYLGISECTANDLRRAHVYTSHLCPK